MQIYRPKGCWRYMHWLWHIPRRKSRILRNRWSSAGNSGVHFGRRGSDTYPRLPWVLRSLERERLLPENGKLLIL